jgi:hypothetical protein
VAVAGVCIGLVASLPGCRFGPRSIGPGSSCPAGWRIVPSANPGATVNELRDVVALSDDRAWAVGVDRSGPGLIPHPEGPIALGDPHPLIERWDGTRWAAVESPAILGQLDAVAAGSARDVWAVGERYRTPHSGFPSVLAEHWEGTRWQVTTVPHLSSRQFEVHDVSVTRSGDAWIVGTMFDPGHYVPLILHWDGSAWHASNGATGTAPAQLNGVDAVRPDDVWAVGYRGGSGSTPPATSLVERWNGNRWAVIPSPNAGLVNPRTILEAVDARTDRDVWAVGSRVGRRPGASITVAEHWDGRRFAVVPTPNHGGDNSLTAVTAVSTSEAWAVLWLAGFLARWDGTRWTAAQPCSFGDESDPAASVAVRPDGSVWVVGSVNDGDRDHYHTSTVVQLFRPGSRASGS